MLKLSIIVPVYNVQPYLRKCVESLCNQDLAPQEYEIILVDDGSTDGSGELCDEIVKDATRLVEVKVIHQKNAGLSAARNAGLTVATGKYVQFVDSDDYLEPNVLGDLIAQCERENLDVLRFDYQNVRVVDAARLDARHLDTTCKDASRIEYEVFEPNKYPHRVDRRTDIVDGETYLNERMGYACYAVMFVVRCELIFNSLAHSFINSFTEGIHFEDVDWTPRMLLAAKRVNATQAVVYNYLVREGSITKTGTDAAKKRKNIEDSMLVAEQMGKLYRQHPQCQWLRNLQSSMACGVLTTVAREFYKERHDYIYRMNAWHVFPLAVANQGKTYTRRARMVNILGARGYCFAINYLNL